MVTTLERGIPEEEMIEVAIGTEKMRKLKISMKEIDELVANIKNELEPEEEKPNDWIKPEQYQKATEFLEEKEKLNYMLKNKLRIGHFYQPMVGDLGVILFHLRDVKKNYPDFVIKNEQIDEWEIKLGKLTKSTKYIPEMTHERIVEIEKFADDIIEQYKIAKNKMPKQYEKIDNEQIKEELKKYEKSTN